MRLGVPVDLHYFAYGSNMSLRRLRQRTPGARPMGSYTLAGHELRFHKQGRDGSGKCDAFYTGTEAHAVLGVLYRLPAREKPLLDRAEGLGYGYREQTIRLHSPRGHTVQAFCYLATLTDPRLYPYAWYKEHVLVGAREAALPDAYIAGIERVPAVEDPDPRRAARQRQIHF